MKKALILIAVLLTAAGWLFLLDEQKPQPKNERLSVLVSTFALNDAAAAVCGDWCDAETVVPAGVDVHGFAPSPKTMVRLQDTALFIYSGAGLEPWAETFAQGGTVLDASLHVNLHPIAQEGEAHETEDADEHGHEGHEHDESCAHGMYDPHYWLDPMNMAAVAQTIARKLAELDPAHAEGFMANAEAYVQVMRQLDHNAAARLGTCAKNEIVLNHNAFGYLAERYGFEVHAISALSPEAMPSAKTMAQLSDLVRDENISVIFFESFVSDRLVQALSRETGAKVDVLETLANISAEQANAGIGYTQLMERNIEKLAGALECQ